MRECVECDKMLSGKKVRCVSCKKRRKADIDRDRSAIRKEARHARGLLRRR